MNVRLNTAGEGASDPCDVALSEAGIERDLDGRIEACIEEPDELVSYYIGLDAVRAALEAHLDEIKAEVTRLEPRVVDYFAQHGKTKDTRRGKTLFIRVDQYPRIVGDREKLVEALAGDPSTAHLVKQTVNSQSLRGFLLHDCPTDEETLEKTIPEHLVGKLGVAEKVRAKVARA